MRTRLQDAFAHCGVLVRAADRDRFIAALFAPQARRDALFALYAFNSEVARVREVVRSALPGEIRLQWWIDVLHRERDEEASGNPVAAALLDVIARYDIAAALLIELVEAHRFDLYEEPMASLGDLEDYAVKTSSHVFAVAARLLCGAAAEAVTRPAGIAYAVTNIVRALPLHLDRRQLYLPTDLLERHAVRSHDLFSGRSSAALVNALSELRALARLHLDAAAERITELPAQAIPALLPVALVRPSLDRLEKSLQLAPAGVSPWRRQWLIWRAARNPARITR
jgi:15-cis-phytoene synthase